MNNASIIAAIAANPVLQALKAFDNYQAIAKALSSGLFETCSRMVSTRGLAELVPEGPATAEITLMKLEGSGAALAASTDLSKKVLGSLINRQLKFLSSNRLDFGSTVFRSMLDQFIVLNILMQSEVDKLKSIAQVPTIITHEAVTTAIRGV